MSDETEVFLHSYVARKDKSFKKQAHSALKLWKDSVKKSSEQVNRDDIIQFFYTHKNMKPRSLSVYLLHIAKYLGWKNQDLEKYVMEKRKAVEERIKPASESPIDHHGVLKMLKEVTELRDKLIVRLLLWNKIPIGCLEDLKVRDISIKEKSYQIYCERERGGFIRGDLYSDTSKIISSIIEEKNLKSDDKLIGISVRQIQKLISEYAKKIGIPKKVNPKDLRQFGKNALLRDMLIEEYERVQKRWFLPQKIKELEKDEIIRPLIMQTALVTDENFRQLSPHDQIVYKFGIILDTIGVKKIQLDLTSKIPTPPFKSERKESYKIKNNRYDVKGFYKEQLFVVEVQDKGNLILTLFKLNRNELRSAKRGLLLLDRELERELEKKLKRDAQFEKLRHELKVFYKDDINEVYSYCKKFLSLGRARELTDEIGTYLQEKKRTILA